MMTIILFAMVICLFVLICVLLYWVYYYKMPEGKDVNDLDENSFKSLAVYRR